MKNRRRYENDYPNEIYRSSRYQNSRRDFYSKQNTNACRNSYDKTYGRQQDEEEYSTTGTVTGAILAFLTISRNPKKKKEKRIVNKCNNVKMESSILSGVYQNIRTGEVLTINNNQS